MKILVIEDHIKIRENICEFLRLQKHLAEGVRNGKEALSLLHGGYDVMILDINMPEMNGRDFLEHIRNEGIHTPVLALTSNSTLEDKIDIFSLGADDYVTKPFEMRELEMRILALYRRKNHTIESIISFGNCQLNIEKRLLTKNGETIELTQKEYLILEFLARNKGFPKTKTQILEAVWGLREAELNFNSITLEVHISSLRKKIDKNAIQTVKGIGYIIY